MRLLTSCSPISLYLKYDISDSLISSMGSYTCASGCPQPTSSITSLADRPNRRRCGTRLRLPITFICLRHAPVGSGQSLRGSPARPYHDPNPCSPGSSTQSDSSVNHPVLYCTARGTAQYVKDILITLGRCVLCRTLCCRAKARGGAIWHDSPTCTVKATSAATFRVVQ